MCCVGASSPAGFFLLSSYQITASFLSEGRWALSYLPLKIGQCMLHTHKSDLQVTLRERNNLYYFANDHLGGTALVMDDTGVIYRWMLDIPPGLYDFVCVS